MAVIDDAMLDSLLRQAGDAFEVPAHGPADILERALGAHDAPADDADPDPMADLGPVPTHRRWGQAVRTHRLLSIAAVVVLVGAITGAGLLAGGGNTPTPVRSAGAPARGGVAGSAPFPTSTSTTEVAPSAGTGTSSSPSQFNSALPASPTPKASGAAAGGLNAASGGSTTAGTTGAGAPSLPSDAVGQSAKVEQTGSLNLTVAKGTLSAVMGKLSYLATAANGFVANSQTQSGASTDSPPSGTITLQVPVASFDTVLKGAQSLGKTSQLTTKATDVTGQYVDLQARITALQDSRQQYLTIMAKATSVGDVLAVQAQLDSLQQQIEQLQGQLQILTSETAYSTLTITVGERGTTPPHHPKHHAASGVDKAWHASLHGFAAGVDGLIRLAGPVLFGLLCLAVVLLGGRVLWRRIQRHNL